MPCKVTHFFCNYEKNTKKYARLGTEIHLIWHIYNILFCFFNGDDGRCVPSRSVPHAGQSLPLWPLVLPQ